MPMSRPVHLPLFFSTRSIVLGCSSTSSSSRTSFASSRARTGSPGDQPRLQEGEDIVVDLVRTARPRLCRHQSGDPGRVEVRLGLIVGRPGDAVFVGRLRHRHFVDGDAAQHLVFDLHDIVRIEELAGAELRVAHLVRRQD